MMPIRYDRPDMMLRCYVRLVEAAAGSDNTSEGHYKPTRAVGESCCIVTTVPASTSACLAQPATNCEAITGSAMLL